MPATNISFKTCVYLAPVLIMLSMSDGTRPPCATLEKLTIVPRANLKFASRSRSIWIIYRYSRLRDLIPNIQSESYRCFNAIVCHVMLPIYAYHEDIQCARIEFPRFTGLVAARNTNSNGCEKIFKVISSYTCTCLIVCISHRITSIARFE